MNIVTLVETAIYVATVDKLGDVLKSLLEWMKEHKWAPSPNKKHSYGVLTDYMFIQFNRHIGFPLFSLGFSHTHFYGGFRSQLKLFQGGSLPDPDDERGLHPARGTWGWSRPGDNLVLHFTAFSGIRNSKSGFYKWKFCSLAVSWVNRAGRKTDNHSHSTKSNHSSSTQRSRCTTHTLEGIRSLGNFCTTKNCLHSNIPTFSANKQRNVYTAIFQYKEDKIEMHWINWNPQLRILYMAGFRLGPDTTRRVSWQKQKRKRRIFFAVAQLLWQGQKLELDNLTIALRELHSYTL